MDRNKPNCPNGDSQSSSYSSNNIDCSGYQIVSDRCFKCTKCETEFFYKSLAEMHCTYHCGKNIKDIATFNCHECNVPLSAYPDLVTHLNNEHADKLYGIKKECKDFKKHSVLIDNMFHCEFCNKQFKHEKNAVNHIRFICDKTPFVESTFQCYVCGKWYKRLDHLLLHMEFHGESRCPVTVERVSDNLQDSALETLPHSILQIPGPSYSTTKSSHNDLFVNSQSTTGPLDKHASKPINEYCVQVSENQFKCTFCGKLFGYKKTAIKHLKSSCPKNKLERQAFQCDKCGGTTKSLKALKAHKELLHANHSDIRKTSEDCEENNSKNEQGYDQLSEKCFRCQKCGTDFLYKSLAEMHCTYHCGKNIKEMSTFICHECNVHLSSYSSFATHLSAEHADIMFGQTNQFTEFTKYVVLVGKKIYCQFCNKEFKRKNAAVGHIRFSCDKTPFASRSFQCYICGKQYKRPDMLRLHFESHGYLQQKSNFSNQTSNQNLSNETKHSSKSVESSENVSIPTTSQTQIVKCLNSQNPSRLLTKTQNYQSINQIKTKKYKCTFCKKTFRHKGNKLMHLRHNCPKSTENLIQLRSTTSRDNNVIAERVKNSIANSNKIYFNTFTVNTTNLDRETIKKHKPNVQLCESAFSSTDPTIVYPSPNNQNPFESNQQQLLNNPQSLEFSSLGTKQTTSSTNSKSTSVGRDEQAIMIKNPYYIKISENKYKCTFCGKIFTYKNSTIRHIKFRCPKNLKQRQIYKCSECKQTTRNLNALKSHKMYFNHNNIGLQLTSDVCEENIKSIEPGYEKLWEKCFKCKKCKTDFLYESLAIMHCKYHCGKTINKTTVFNCHECNVHLKSYNNLVTHLLTQHADKLFGQEKQNRDVMKYIPKFGKMFKCQFCNKQISQENNAISHVKFSCNKKPFVDSSFQCYICGKIFGRYDSFRLHVETHGILELNKVKCIELRCLQLSNDIYQCLLCKKYFCSMINLHCHYAKSCIVSKLVDKSIKCNICDRRFKGFQRYSKHLRKVHLIDKNISYKTVYAKQESKSTMDSRLVICLKRCERECSELDKINQIKETHESLETILVPDNVQHRSNKIGEKLCPQTNFQIFQCNECGITQKFDELKIHSNVHHGLSITKYNVHKLSTTVRLSFGNKNNRYIQCPLCYKISSIKQNMHINTCKCCNVYHSKIICKFCENIFQSKIALSYHIKYKCLSQKKGYPCGLCAFLGISPEEIVLHLKSMHQFSINEANIEYTNTFSCVVCNTQFKNEHSARFHAGVCMENLKLSKFVLCN